MYCNFFGLSEKPFNVTPDPKYLYMTKTSKELLASLIYGIRERRGFITVVGEVGTGKTTLLNALLDELDTDVKVALLFNTDITFKQILIMTLNELGVSNYKKKITKAEALIMLNEFTLQQMANGGNVALIIDEAQDLDLRALENLRLLSNLETRKQKLIQIILSGQPELDYKLNQPELRQLSQRISLKRYALPLNESDFNEYIEHRLKVADYKGTDLFNKDSLKLIWNYTKGIPRKINIICDNALLIGFAVEKKIIDEKIVKEAIRDLSYSPYNNNKKYNSLATSIESN